MVGGKGMSETPYTETEVVLAALNKDNSRLEQLVTNMLPNERRTLLEALDRVSDAMGRTVDIV
jgi:hypothetical protein